MAQQIPMTEHVKVGEALGHGAVEFDPNARLFPPGIVNVVLHGPIGAGDHGWVLIDAGVPRSKPTIERVAAGRFGPDAKAAAIILTHGHFDHVGALEPLAAEWDVRSNAHPSSMAISTGRALSRPIRRSGTG